MDRVPLRSPVILDCQKVTLFASSFHVPRDLSFPDEPRADHEPVLPLDPLLDLLVE